MEKTNRKKIFFVYKKMAPFVQNDIDIFKKDYQLHLFQIKPFKNFIYIIIKLIQQFFVLLFNIKKYNTIYIWFADYHAFFPVVFANIFNKKVFVVNGGFDADSISEYKYGLSQNIIREKVNKYIFKKAICLPVANRLKKYILAIQPNAILNVIYTGHDETIFHFKDFKREKIIFTAANTVNLQTLYMKGLDRFNELAHELSDYKFIIAGINSILHNNFSNKAPNLILKGFVSQDELIYLFQKASFYAQLSRSEGLPGALCEAMLCGCIPIGMDVGDIKEIIEGIGFPLDKWEPKLFKNFIESNHNKENLRRKARQRIIEKYSLKQREVSLKKLIYG